MEMVLVRISLHLRPVLVPTSSRYSENLSVLTCPKGPLSFASASRLELELDQPGPSTLHLRH